MTSRFASATAHWNGSPWCEAACTKPPASAASAIRREVWWGLVSSAQRLAGQTAADHRLRWRLRNRRPDPDAIASITDAWLARPCPADLQTHY